MTYMRVAPIDVPGGAVASAPSSKGTSVSIDLRVGVRIPLIIYVGDGSAQTTVDDASLGRTLDGKRAIDVKLNRSGPRSSYVGVSVYSKKNDIKKLVAHNPRVVTFFPLESRIVNMPTTDDPFEGGVLQVEINDYNDPQRRVHSSKEFKVK